MLMSRRIVRTAVVVTAVAIGAATDSCGGSNEPGTVVVLVAASSITSQNGTVNQPVGVPPAVIVTRNGIPDPGVPVTFTVASGGGSLRVERRRPAPTALHASAHGRSAPWREASRSTPMRRIPRRAVR